MLCNIVIEKSSKAFKSCRLLIWISIHPTLAPILRPEIELVTLLFQYQNLALPVSIPLLHLFSSFLPYLSLIEVSHLYWSWHLAEVTPPRLTLIQTGQNNLLLTY
ncbi:hypothetical protein ElyMa_004619600 [Elysia marginata]|uniref:Uncharacterized protein n=1 Tax=Elysia marginata TaxID=1093978 RepID=A0AAV4I0A9_9GAST|nr:hypothetical protein ElyMa_004619600 [Elysia marginata]